MCDVFEKPDLVKLLRDKRVVFIGGSNVRASYKDMLCLFHGSNLIGQRVLKSKMENSVFHDKLMSQSKKTNGRDYKEERLFKTETFECSFHFVTQVYGTYVERLITRLSETKHPDVVIINSSLWDISRWGVNSVKLFKKNLILLMRKFREVLSEDCLVIWMTAPPVAQEIRGGFLVTQLEFLKYSMRFHIMEANTYARRVVVKYGYDVLDVHYHLRMQIDHRCADGIHWDPEAVRYVTNLILTHISVAWDVPLPRRSAAIIGDSVDDKKYEFINGKEETYKVTVPKRKVLLPCPNVKIDSFQKRRRWKNGSFSGPRIEPYRLNNASPFAMNSQPLQNTSLGRQSRSLTYQYSFSYPFFPSAAGPSHVEPYCFASPQDYNINNSDYQRNNRDLSAEGYSDRPLPEQLYGSENHDYWLNRRSRQHLPRHSQRKLQRSGTSSDALRNSEDNSQAYPQDYTCCDLPSTCMF